MHTNIKNEPTSFSEVLQLLTDEAASRASPKAGSPRTLSLTQIKEASLVFQPRLMDEKQAVLSEDHTQALVKAIQNEPSHTLDPMTVWWSGKRWILIDGHHRFKAYNRAKSSPAEVPVNVFDGDLYEAIAESTKLNAKDKLAMSSNDKYNRAWKLTVLDKYSKSTLASICKVGTTTISRMRNIFSEIKSTNPQHFEEFCLKLDWQKAQNYGKEDRVFDDGWLVQRATEWATRLGKTFGSTFATQPDVAAMALEIYSKGLVDGLKELWLAHENPDF